MRTHSPWHGSPERDFLTFRKFIVLNSKDSVSSTQAKKRAEAEYDIVNPTQKIDSDFDKEVRKLLQNGGNNE